MVYSRVIFNKMTTRYFLSIILSRKFFKIASCFLVIYSLNHYRPFLISKNHSKDVKKFIIDDSSVDSSSYRDDYRERIKKICKITEQRNTENRQKKVILKYQRKSTLKDEYLVVMYTEKFRQVPFFDADKTNVCIFRNEIFNKKIESKYSQINIR